MNIVLYPVICRRACLVYAQAYISKPNSLFFFFYDFLLEIIAGDGYKTIAKLLLIC